MDYTHDVASNNTIPRPDLTGKIGHALYSKDTTNTAGFAPPSSTPLLSKQSKNGDKQFTKTVSLQLTRSTTLQSAEATSKTTTTRSRTNATISGPTAKTSSYSNECKSVELALALNQTSQRPFNIDQLYKEKSETRQERPKMSSKLAGESRDIITQMRTDTKLCAHNGEFLELPIHFKRSAFRAKARNLGAGLQGNTTSDKEDSMLKTKPQDNAKKASDLRVIITRNKYTDRQGKAENVDESSVLALPFSSNLLQSQSRGSVQETQIQDATSRKQTLKPSDDNLFEFVGKPRYVIARNGTYTLKTTAKKNHSIELLVSFNAKPLEAQTNNPIIESEPVDNSSSTQDAHIRNDKLNLSDNATLELMNEPSRTIFRNSTLEAKNRAKSMELLSPFNSTQPQVHINNQTFDSLTDKRGLMQDTKLEKPSVSKEIDPALSNALTTKHVPILANQISDTTKDKQTLVYLNPTSTLEKIEFTSNKQNESSVKLDNKKIRESIELGEVKRTPKIETTQMEKLEIIPNASPVFTRNETGDGAAIENAVFKNIAKMVPDSITTETDEEQDKVTADGSFAEEALHGGNNRYVATAEDFNQDAPVHQEASAIEPTHMGQQGDIEVELPSTTTIRIPISKITTPIINFRIDATTESMSTRNDFTDSTEQVATKHISQRPSPAKRSNKTVEFEVKPTVANSSLLHVSVTYSMKTSGASTQPIILQEHRFRTFNKAVGIAQDSVEADTTFATRNESEYLVNETAAKIHKQVSLENLLLISTKKPDSKEVEEATGVALTEAQKNETIRALPEGSVDLNALLVNDNTNASHYEASNRVRDGIPSMSTTDNVSLPFGQAVEKAAPVSNSNVISVLRSLESSNESETAAADASLSVSRPIISIPAEDIQASKNIGMVDLDIFSHFGTVNPKMVYGIIRETSNSSSTAALSSMQPEQQKKSGVPVWRSPQTSYNTTHREGFGGWSGPDPNFVLGLENLFEWKNDQAKMRIVNSRPNEVSEPSSKPTVRDDVHDEREAKDALTHSPSGIPSFFSDGPPLNMMQFPWSTPHNKLRNSEANFAQKFTTEPVPMTGVSTTTASATTTNVVIGNRDNQSTLSTTPSPVRSSTRKMNLFFLKKLVPVTPLANVPKVASKKFNLFSSLTQSPIVGNSSGSKSVNRRPSLPSKRLSPVRWTPSIEPPQSDESDNRDPSSDVAKETFLSTYERRFVVDTISTPSTSTSRTPGLNLPGFHQNDHDRQTQKLHAGAAGGFHWDWSRRRSHEDPYDLGQDDDPYDLLLRGTPPAPRPGYHQISERARATLLMCIGIVVGATVFFASMLLVCRRRNQNARLLRRRAVDRFITEQHDAASEAASSYGGSHSSYGRKNLLSSR